MFEVGDRVVCIDNLNNKLFLILDKEYIIVSINKDVVWITDSCDLFCGKWNIKHFTSDLLYYRRHKILKLKERINGRM